MKFLSWCQIIFDPLSAVVSMFHAPNASQVLRYTSENVFVPLTVGEELEISQIQLEGIITDHYGDYAIEFLASFFSQLKLFSLKQFYHCVPSEISKVFYPINYILRYYSSLEIASEYFRSRLIRFLSEVMQFLQQKNI